MLEKTKQDKLNKVKRRKKIFFWFSFLLWLLALAALVIVIINRFSFETARFWSCISVISAIIATLGTLTYLRLGQEQWEIEQEIQREGGVIIINGVKHFF